jgi:hypothetical protein
MRPDLQPYPLLAAVSCLLGFIIVSLMNFDDLPTHRYAFKSFYYSEDGDADVRPDYISGVAVKHDPSYAIVEHTCYPNGGAAETTDLLISIEILYQLATAANIPIGASDDDVASRLKFAARNIATVNYDKSLVLADHHIVQNTIFVAFAMHKSFAESTVNCPFPRTPTV